jgi:hypothetical protein
MISRRGLLGGVLGCFFGAVPAGPQPSYFFSWGGDGPYTTDPRYAGRITLGTHQEIFLNGRSVSHRKVRACFTGPQGWVDLLAGDDGVIRFNKTYTDVLVKRLHGDVRYVDYRRSVAC